jgi:hypothetical protein
MPVVAFREKSVVLAEQNGWPIISAKGYVDGEVFRKRRKDPPLHAMVGIDGYSEGFRAGYFDRPLSAHEFADNRLQESAHGEFARSELQDSDRA